MSGPQRRARRHSGPGDAPCGRGRRVVPRRRREAKHLPFPASGSQRCSSSGTAGPRRTRTRWSSASICGKISAVGAAIVDAVNFVFRQIMTPGHGEIAYGPEAELVSAPRSVRPMRSRAAGTRPWKYTLLDARDVEGGCVGGARTAGRHATKARHDLADLTGLQRGGRSLVARRIRQLVQGGEAVGVGPGRRSLPSCTLRRIVILLRAARHRANELVDMLARIRRAGVRRVWAPAISLRPKSKR